MRIVIQPREKWKIVRYPTVLENYYYVSNYGNVKDKDDKPLKVYIPKDNRPIVYLRVDETDKEKRYPFRIYRLVAYEFVPNDDPIHKVTVNHKDFDTTNSFYLNLEWVTYKENNNHAMINGVGRQFLKGSNHRNSKYTDEMVKYICQCIVNKIDTKTMYLNLIKKYKELKCVSYKNFVKQVSKIKHNERWTHITKNYNFNLLS